MDTIKLSQLFQRRLAEAAQSRGENGKSAVPGEALTTAERVPIADPPLYLSALLCVQSNPAPVSPPREPCLCSGRRPISIEISRIGI
jgi:hypothetical protein